jgi:hypothetical protein
MRLHEGNEKMSEERWLRACDELRNLIEVSQCLCRDFNLKHPEEEFEQTLYRLTATPFIPYIILSHNNQQSAKRVNVNYSWCHPQGGALRRKDTCVPDDGHMSGRNMQ